MGEGQKEGDAGLGAWTPGAILERLFKVDPAVARVLVIGLGVLAAVAIVGSWRIEASRVLPTMLWLAGGYLAFAFLAKVPGWLGILLGALGTLGLAAYLTLFAVQLVAQNILSPPVMAAGCFFSPGVQGCPMNIVPPDARRPPLESAEAAGPADGSSGEGPAEASVEAPAVGTGDPPPEAVVVAPDDGGDAFDASEYRVFVQFATRGLDGGDVDGLIAQMVENGWIVGETAEPLPSAFGLNEVRFFHADDRDAAARLAAAVERAAPWVDEVRVRDLTSFDGDAEPGLLEIWTSR